jgi:hypothetical protein
MRCEDAIEIISGAGSEPRSGLRSAMDHAMDCDDCHAALRALDATRVLREEVPPIVDEGAVERAIDRALTSGSAERYRRGFWSGLASGAGMAAAIAALAVGVWLFGDVSEAPVTVPEVRIALNQRSDITVTLESPEPLANAEVRVELRGALALDGYAGQRELRWSTDLDRGVNQLTLPVVAIDASGGQVLVEVTHADQRRHSYSTCGNDRRLRDRNLTAIQTCSAAGSVKMKRHHDRTRGVARSRSGLPRRLGSAENQLESGPAAPQNAVGPDEITQH